MTTRTTRHHGQAGFSVIEILMTLAMLSVLSTMTLQTFRSWLPRLDLRAAAQQAHGLISKARLEAIKRGVTTTVQIDVDEGVLFAFADVNGDPVVGSEGHASYLKFDPDAAAGEKQTDYEIGRLYLTGTTLGTATFDPSDGFTTIPDSGHTGLVFSSSGSPQDLGAFRIADRNERNVLEVAIASLAGKVEVRKYLNGTDSPTASSGFFTQGARGSGDNVWVWY